MIPVMFVIKVNDNSCWYPCLNPYEAIARASARSTTTGEMHVAMGGHMDAGFAPKQAAYGPFRFGEVFA